MKAHDIAGTGTVAHSRAGGTHLHRRRSAVVDRTERQEHTRPILARPDPNGPVKHPQLCCNTRATPPSLRLAKPSPPPPGGAAERRRPGPPKPIWARPSPSGARGAQTLQGGSRRPPPRSWRPADPTPQHHLHPAAPARSFPRGTAAREREGPDPLSWARGKEGRRRRRRPGFARRPLPAAATEGRGRGRRRWPATGPNPHRPWGGKRGERGAKRFSLPIPTTVGAASASSMKPSKIPKVRATNPLPNPSDLSIQTTETQISGTVGMPMGSK
jgi:hypothetical protein